MKLLVGTVCLALAVAVSAADDLTVNDLDITDYHFRVGIPKARQIWEAEQQAALSPERIVGGSATDISATPYQVGLVITVMWFFTSVCGGSLIAQNRVLTAAHCVDSTTNNGVTTVTGSNTLFSGGQRIVSGSISLHPNWSSSTINNDVAVIRLNSAAALSNSVRLIALATGNNLYVGQTALASGWGLTSDGGSIGNNQVLSSVSLPIITNAECAAVYGTFVRDTNICTSGAGGRGTCSGDSGGPLAIGNTVVGIVSYGAAAGCAVGLPAAYARVTSYVSWINAQ